MSTAVCILDIGLVLDSTKLEHLNDCFWDGGYYLVHDTTSRLNQLVNISHALDSDKSRDINHKNGIKLDVYLSDLRHRTENIFRVQWDSISGTFQTPID
jgi:hypothetical protein